jgi:hypothetical protein
MKHITYGHKSLLVGDETTDLLLDYAAAVARHKVADTVMVNAVSSDGDETLATFLLNEGTTLMAETTHSALPEPSNAEANAYLQLHLRLLESPGQPAPDSSELLASMSDVFFHLEYFQRSA